MGFLLLLILTVTLWGLHRFVVRGERTGWPFRAGLNRQQEAVLTRHFKFYQLLPERPKKMFASRVARFIRLKQFVPRQMDEVTDEMKVLIAASAIQLTFGFPQVFLSYFKYIVIFPEQFFSSDNQRYHKGEVNPKARAIVLSWKHFVEGYADSEGINLGLHEMAHALQLENIVMNHEYNFLSPAAAKNWQQLASTEIIKIRNGEDSFFRPYGATDHREFFAVAVENFFEKPQAFAQYHYALYKALCEVLRQDPLLLYQEL